MTRRNGRVADDSGYISYADALDWTLDFCRAYRCTVDWKLTVRKERDLSIGVYVTAFVREREGGRKLIGHQVVRYGRDQEAVTAPAAMVKALILLDRSLGSRLDQTEDLDGGADPEQPLS